MGQVRSDILEVEGLVRALGAGSGWLRPLRGWLKSPSGWLALTSKRLAQASQRPATTFDRLAQASPWLAQASQWLAQTSHRLVQASLTLAQSSQKLAQGSKRLAVGRGEGDVRTFVSMDVRVYRFPIFYRTSSSLRAKALPVTQRQEIVIGTLALLW